VINPRPDGLLRFIRFCSSVFRIRLRIRVSSSGVHLGISPHAIAGGAVV
jgi:hypothetical protein